MLYVVSFGTSSVQPFEFVNQFGMTIWPWPVAVLNVTIWLLMVFFIALFGTT